jgi:anaerobic dimethyl sulfoxide reductase subunit C (anchor subunit)
MNLREWALPVYTILMQFSVGMLFVLWCLRSLGMGHLDAVITDRIVRKPMLVVVFAMVAAIIGSHFHLSRPYFSFLAVLNFAHSWLSREIVFTVLLLACCVLLAYLVWFQEDHARLKTWLGWMAVVYGFIVIFCMSHLYLIPTQPTWNSWVTVTVFFGTALLLGAASAAALLIMDSVFSAAKEPELAAIRYDILQRISIPYTVLAIMGAAGILALNIYQIVTMRAGDSLAQTSLGLLLGVYGPLLGMRLISLVVGVWLLSLTIYWIYRRHKTLTEVVVPIHLACLLLVVGEILGRFLFYATHVRVGV